MKKKPSGRPPATRATSKRLPNAAPPPIDLHVGRFLKLVTRGSWEYAERVRADGVVVIVAITEDDRLLLTEQFRPPVGRRVIELPAGLAGDSAEDAGEELAIAARRELLEETGYRAERMEFLMCGPSSAGLTSETVSFFHATGLVREADGGGVAGEDIRLHLVSLARLNAWLKRQERDGLLVDHKIHAGLRLVGKP